MGVPIVLSNSIMQGSVMNTKISGSSMSRGTAPETMLNGDLGTIHKTVRFHNNSHKGNQWGLENSQAP